MGFYSYKTADTGKSIWNIYTGYCKPVYLLQPEKAAIYEPAYEGYGSFGHVHSLNWLASANRHLLKGGGADLDDEEMFNIGLAMRLGRVYRDENNGDIWHIFRDLRSLYPGKLFAGDYGMVIPEIGRRVNALIEEGRFVPVEFSALLDIKYPLKFSFDKDARYEGLPASEDCPHQGFFR